MSFTITDNLMNKVDKLIQTVRDLKEEGEMMASPPTNNASGEHIKGLPPDSPPVNLDLRKSRRRHWNPFFKELVGMFRRKNLKNK